MTGAYEPQRASLWAAQLGMQLEALAAKFETESAYADAEHLRTRGPHIAAALAEMAAMSGPQAAHDLLKGLALTEGITLPDVSS
ncbi:hypothetical protein [Streptomyces sp. GZWMJZ-114]|uniref:hypothetical protein n=1 Tax=Streptomyces sp. GZWMJZ-114 TaxID=2494734 RepID=UPI0010139297|nr:hypothetical protein [Streptomyces sp. GZWMJZ-114]